MSDDLDLRGQQASIRLRELVNNAPLHPLPPTMAPPGTALVPMLTAAATVLAAVIVVIWLVLPPPQVGEPAASTTLPPAITATSIATSTTASEPVTTVPVTGTAPVTTVTIPADVTPPILTITEPLDGSESVEKNVLFVGTTEAGTRVYAGQYEAAVDGNGRWEIVLVLAEGANTAHFRAVDAAGNASEATVTVYLIPPTTTIPTTTTTKDGELAPFEAHYTWGQCSINPPYDEYYGKGQPGSEVRVRSEYGSGATVVGPEGNWYVKVTFPEAPSGVPFLVTITDQYGRGATFEFVSTVIK